VRGLRRRQTEPAPTNHWEELSRLFDAVDGERPEYAWSVLHAALVARRLGLDAVSALELGVAGGSGLVALENVATQVAEQVGVEIEVHGFDSGQGLPAPVDHRDAPYLIAEGDFAMNVPALRARLRRAELHLGPVSETIPAFLAKDRAPVGFAAFDLDYYSSTRDALGLAAAPAGRLMPRFLAYFDDVLGYPWGRSNGPRPAIEEFNAQHSATRVVDELLGLSFMVPAGQSAARWPQAMFLVHVLDHPRYGDPEHTAFSHQLELG
jgi:hypothetical protein